MKTREAPKSTMRLQGALMAETIGFLLCRNVLGLLLKARVGARKHHESPEALLTEIQ